MRVEGSTNPEHTEPQHSESEIPVKRQTRTRTWIKRLGFWGLMFFLLKGLLWLTIPALIAIFATN